MPKPIYQYIIEKKIEELKEKEESPEIKGKIKLLKEIKSEIKFKKMEAQFNQERWEKWQNMGDFAKKQLEKEESMNIQTLEGGSFLSKTFIIREQNLDKDKKMKDTLLRLRRFKERIFPSLSKEAERDMTPYFKEEVFKRTDINYKHGLDGLTQKEKNAIFLLGDITNTESDSYMEIFQIETKENLIKYMEEKEIELRDFIFILRQLYKYCAGSDWETEWKLGKERIQAESFEITAMEGKTNVVKRYENTKVDSWEEINDSLEKIAELHKHGNKIFIKITFENGTEYNTKYYLRPLEKEFPNLGQHILDIALTNSGRKKPAHMKKDDYQRFLAQIIEEETQKKYRKLLDYYELKT
jgi:hypothetical protein